MAVTQCIIVYHSVVIVFLPAHDLLTVQGGLLTTPGAVTW